MNVYKFGAKPEIVQPKTIYWKPFEVKYPPKKVNPVLWEIFTQQSLTLKPGETKSVVLGFGFLMSKWVDLTSLSYNLNIRQLSLSNEVILEDTADVVTTITNNSSKLVRIQENEFLCHLCYSI